MQVDTAHRLDPMHGPQVARVAVHQGGRQQAFGQESLWAIDIGHDRIQQSHALLDAAFDMGPVAGVNDEREQVLRPGALRSLFVGVDVVGHPVVPNLALQAGRALVQVGRGTGFGLRKKFGPSPRGIYTSSY